MTGPSPTPLLGRVLGTEDATPTTFWFLVAQGQSVQLDDLVVARTRKPDGQEVAFYGLVDSVRKRHEGVGFESDVDDIMAGLLPASVSYSARVLVTRVHPEDFVPPEPGDTVWHARGHDLSMALSADKMGQAAFPGGLMVGGEIMPINYRFVNGESGGHINISGISGVATKTSYALFLLHSIFRSRALSLESAQTKAVIFNVKGEDLLFLDKPNRNVQEVEAGVQAGKRLRAGRYELLGLPTEAFRDVQFLAPPRPNADGIMAHVEHRTDGGVTPFLFTLRDFCRRRMLPYAFSDRSASLNLGFVIGSIEEKLFRLARAGDTPYLSVDDWQPDPEAALDEDIQFADVGGIKIDTFPKLVSYLEYKLLDQDDGAGDPKWVAKQSAATLQAFVRRLRGVQKTLAPLIRGDVSAAQAEQYRPDLTRQDRQLSVVDIHNLSGHAQMFVVGVLLRDLFEYKERVGRKQNTVFVVLDELNKYAPREGDSPIKDVLLDIAERGRSLGIILIGAQQTASEVERRIVSNAAIRVVGRLDMAEAERPEYRFLPQSFRARAGILQPGTMLVSQPDVPNPVLVNYPFPAWATRADEVAPSTNSQDLRDLFGF
ncbi:ATP-binding protein [Deinococcus aquiradiocola]|uniref:ATPase n=1 Tax=Deinococcus aquiradiocola TaxID=393059 RepID=A0A917P4H6_9DEIO|nr:ATP-binding protein [Deinococcus aquiradiocola]GGJ61255.1 ATPase [Deinococcus aquiradiocola]